MDAGYLQGLLIIMASLVASRAAFPEEGEREAWERRCSGPSEKRTISS